MREYRIVKETKNNGIVQYRVQYKNKNLFGYLFGLWDDFLFDEIHVTCEAAQRAINSKKECEIKSKGNEINTSKVIESCNDSI